MAALRDEIDVLVGYEFPPLIFKYLAIRNVMFAFTRWVLVHRLIGATKMN